MHTSTHTQLPPVDYARLSYLCVKCMISLLFPRFESRRKRRYKQWFIIIIQGGKNHLLVLKTKYELMSSLKMKTLKGLWKFIVNIYESAVSSLKIHFLCTFCMSFFSNILYVVPLKKYLIINLSIVHHVHSSYSRRKKH